MATIAPTRIDLAGGTTDIWPIWALLEYGTTVVNIAIDLTAEVSITKGRNRNSELIQCIIDQYDLPEQTALNIITNFPRQAGLAGSSCITIAAIKCLDSFCGIERDTRSTIQFASAIEAAVMRKPTGTQDYYPILFGGVNAIHYSLGSITHEHIHVKPRIYNLLKSVMLVQPVGMHRSGDENWNILKKIVDGDYNTLCHMETIASAGRMVYDAIIRDDVDALCRGITLDTNARIGLGTCNSNLPLIPNGCAKVCGAGGNACVAIFGKQMPDAIVCNFTSLGAREKE